MWRSQVHVLCIQHATTVFIQSAPSSAFTLSNDVKCLLFAFNGTWLYTIYIFLCYRHFLSYGHPLVPCCPDKRGFTVLRGVNNSQWKAAFSSSFIQNMREFEAQDHNQWCKLHQVTGIPLTCSTYNKLLLPLVDSYVFSSAVILCNNHPASLINTLTVS